MVLRRARSVKETLLRCCAAQIVLEVKHRLLLSSEHLLKTAAPTRASLPTSSTKRRSSAPTAPPLSQSKVSRSLTPSFTVDRHSLTLPSSPLFRSGVQPRHLLRGHKGGLPQLFGRCYLSVGQGDAACRLFTLQQDRTGDRHDKRGQRGHSEASASSGCPHGLAPVSGKQRRPDCIQQMASRRSRYERLRKTPL